ncbi:Uncharacterised protein [Vibrio cholerae]|nr:Uncharacterised protein [Vibrio cholerae]CSD26509.1 Uncharacterised protein [Vibrio cholerae]
MRSDNRAQAKLGRQSRRQTANLYLAPVDRDDIPESAVVR